MKHSYPAFIISDESNSNCSLVEEAQPPLLPILLPSSSPHRRNIYVDIEHEQRVNFQLPDSRQPSICHQSSQPTLRDRVKGSPRFPHRIAPTSSLNALEDGQNASTNLLNNAGNFYQIKRQKINKYLSG